MLLVEILQTQCMKKILFIMMVLCSLTAFKASAQTTTTTTHRYYYYPDANVYYDLNGRDYWYYDQPNSKWVSGTTLPSGMVVARRKHYTVRYSGTDPWRENDTHRQKYKVKKDGRVKVKNKND
ncbi:MAG: hypothetical protein JWN76_120 [Chitinophagaceae bacterium]|nr:hypothetical protein [Chitinophagaceae bacterium]